MNGRLVPLGKFVAVSLALAAAAVGAGYISDMTWLAAVPAQQQPLVRGVLAGTAPLLVLFLAVWALKKGHQHSAVADARFHELLESSPDSVVVVDTELRILQANVQTERIFGHQPADLLGSSPELFIPGFRKLVLDMKPGEGDATPRETTGARKDGSSLPVEVTLRLLEAGSSRAYVGIFRDLTERRRAEESLRQAEVKYRSIFENAAEGIYQVTPEGRFITANNALARMLGYKSPQELMEKVTDIKKQLFVEPAKRSEIRRLSEQSGQARGFEHQAYRKDGTKIWLLGNQRVVRDDQRVLYYEGNFEEITERKRAEEALRESQRALMSLMSNLPGMAYRGANDRERTMEFVSEGALNLTGHAPPQLTGKTGAFGQLIHPDDRTTVWNEIQAALSEDRSYQLQYRIVTATREKTVWEQGKGFRLPGGKLLLEGLIIDISERVRAQEGMRKSEERFRLLAENIHGVFWMTDPPMKELFYVNGAYEQIWGHSRPSLFKNPLSRLETIDPQDQERVRAACAAAVKNGYDEEYRIIRPDGSVRWIWDRAFPIADEKGQVYRLAGIAEDITERKRLEEELLQAQKMEAVGRLAGGIAHDFNNLLTVINGYSEMLLNEFKPGDSQHDYIKQVNKAGERAASLTRQLLAFSRKQMLIPKVVDLNALVVSMKDMVQRLMGEDIDFTLKLDDNLGKVEADPGQLEQVLMNLAVNARDAMPRGGDLSIATTNVELTEADTRNIPESKPGEYALLTVSDTGHGMDAKTKSQIFEPFFTTKEIGKGTGLGLSMVYGIIRQSDGFIDVDSAPERGTTFKIYLPLTGDKRTREPSAPAVDAVVRGHETVLLVEDEEMVRGMTRTLLQKSGYTVIEASDGHHALDVSDKHEGPIHLLVTDVVMPGMNGHDLQVKLAKVRPSMKVLFMSGYTDSALLRHGVLDDNRTILLKPFQPEVFLGTVREVLDK